MLFTGTGSALITPFNDTGAIDWEAFRWLIENVIEKGVNFLVPCGTTGESPTLTHQEHIKAIRFTVEIVNGRLPILAGTGSNSTAEAVDLTKAAKDVGANGVLVVSPYYNKPMKQGQLDYYRQIANIGLPVVLYDIPGRTGKGVPLDAVIELAKEGSICGIKWANGDISWLMDLIKARTDLGLENFSILSGDDNLTYPLIALGGNGVISVLANLLPTPVSYLVRLARMEDREAANLHYKLYPLMKAMFIETNPIPVKTALSLIYPDVFIPRFRSPMCQMEKQNLEKLKQILQSCEVLL